MSWEYERLGDFGSERAARDYVQRNGLDLRDVRTHDFGDRVELEICRSAVDGRSMRDSGEGRRNGWT